MNEPKLELDLLHSVERLTREVEKSMEKRGESVLKRYPLTFALLSVVGVVAVGEGIKGLLEDLGIFKEHPTILLVMGLVILTFTGSLFRKLDERMVE